MFRKMPFILLVIILAIVLLDRFIPLDIKQFLYAVSLSIKAIIVLMLPLIIFGLLFKAAVILANNATKIIGIILVAVCCSNFISTFLSHYVGKYVYSFDLSMILPKELFHLEPLWNLNLPKLIANDKAMFTGIILGILLSKFYKESAHKWATFLETYIGKILNIFIYLIPLFVAGFIVKLQFDGVVNTIIKDYTLIFAVIAIAQFSYIIFAYFILSNLKFQEFKNNLKNMIPAAISGFSTMSSAVSMPLTIMGAEKNTQDKDIARSVVPATVNIHLIGDCFAIPIFAYAVLKSYGIAEPSLLNYLTFTFYFVLAKFSVAAIPGGGIIVMLPILEAYLGFNSDMMSLITALYILFDPVITCANVLGNGAFVKVIDKTILHIKHKKIKIF